MSETATLMTLKYETFMAVGPSRIASCTLAMIDGGLVDPTMAAEMQKLSEDRIKTALKTLEDSFPKAFSQLGKQEPAELCARRHAAIDTLHRVEGALKGKHDQHTLSDLALGHVEPAVSGFLELMLDTLDRAHDATRGDERSSAMDAVKAADNVGRSIQMIAINASIEAARAGDDGKGFKVIAEEVKTLAGQTQSLLAQVSHTLRTY